MYYGNNAYKLEPKHTRKSAPQRKPVAKRAVKSKHKTGARLKPLLIIIGVFAIAFLLCWRYVYIYSQGSEISSKKNELNEIIAMNSHIQMEIERETDINKIYEYATTTLGMKKPDKSQFVYITPQKEDTMNRSQGGIEVATNSILSAINGAVSGIVEYLR